MHSYLVKKLEDRLECRLADFLRLLELLNVLKKFSKNSFLLLGEHQ